jgi:hypothetical protein
MAASYPAAPPFRADHAPINLPTCVRAAGRSKRRPSMMISPAPADAPLNEKNENAGAGEPRRPLYSRKC